MKKLLFLLSVTVGALVAIRLYKNNNQTVFSSPKTDDNSDFFSVSVSAVSDFVKPIEDAIVTVKNNVFGTPYDDLIEKSAIENGLEPNVLYRLLRQESRFRPDIIEGRTKSPVGALGIAQFMPATAVEELGSVDAALDPNKAIPGAARYLAKLRRAFAGDLTKAVAAYNWGIGNVKRKGLAKAPKETVDYARAIVGVDISKG
jgi:soluble lytic murein transglycosylase-like protein